MFEQQIEPGEGSHCIDGCPLVLEAGNIRDLALEEKRTVARVRGWNLTLNSAGCTAKGHRGYSLKAKGLNGGDLPGWRVHATEAGNRLPRRRIGRHRQLRPA